MPLSSSWVKLGWIAAGLLGAAALILMIARQADQAAADRWVQHTLEVSKMLHTVQSEVHEVSDQMRGFVLSRREDWLVAYRQQLSAARRDLAAVGKLTLDNPRQQVRVAALSDRMERHFTWCEYVVDTAHRKGFPAAIDEVTAGRGESDKVALDSAIDSMLSEEESLLVQRQARSLRLRRISFWIDAGLTGLVLAQLGASLWLVHGRYEAFRKEKALLEQGRIYAESIVQTIREPLLVLDTYLRVVSANRAYFEVFQAVPEETEKLPFTELSSGMWNIPELVARLHAVLDEHAVLDDFRVEHEFPKIGKRSLLLNTRKVYRPGNRTGMLLLAIEDDTRRRAAEHRLEVTNTELEGFAYSVAHDLRAPLRGMQGFSEALLEDCAEGLGEDGRQYARHISSAANRMDELIRDLLEYSRVSRAEIKLVPVSLSAVVGAAREQLLVQLAQADITVEEPLPLVVAFQPVLVQAIANLLANAVKFTASGVRPAVRISAHPVGRRVRFSISDNGLGIAPEHHERIFRVFERLHASEAYPGTGIGLAIVRKGVERLGGSVGVESSLGKGACFWIELPAAAT